VSTFVPTPILNKLVAPSYLIDAPFCGLAVVPSCNKILESAPLEAVFIFNVAPELFDIFTSPVEVIAPESIVPAKVEFPLFAISNF
jgi:hypothetical protein